MRRQRTLYALLWVILIQACSFLAASAQKTVHVNGYFRKNGTYVAPYYRSAPGTSSLGGSSSGGYPFYPGLGSSYPAPVTTTGPTATSGDGSNPDMSAGDSYLRRNPGSPLSDIPAPYSPSPDSIPAPFPSNAPGSRDTSQSSIAGQEDKLVLEVMNGDTSSDPLLANYVAQLRERIKQSWAPQKVESFKKSLVYFEITDKEDGVQHLRISSSSGDHDFDKDVARAIEQSMRVSRAPIGRNIVMVALFKSRHIAQSAGAGALQPPTRKSF